MTPQNFHDNLDKRRLVAALADAEKSTVGKIYVYVSHRAIEDALAAARQRFAKLGLAHAHQHRASVLIYIAPKSCKFAIVGDTAIHDRCGEEYWQKIADKLSLDLKAGDLTAALLNAVASLKATLEEHFPRPAR
jgi:uncharacterized membrane protein